MTSILRHPLSPLTRRSLLAFVAIMVVMVVGTLGMEALTGWSLIESFYFMAMIATAEGPPQVPPNPEAMVFAAVMAFVSIGTLITAIGVIFGPFLGYVLHKGVTYAEREKEKRGQQKEGAR